MESDGARALAKALELGQLVNLRALVYASVWSLCVALRPLLLTRAEGGVPVRLYGNAIGDSGATALGTALPHCRNLESLEYDEMTAALR
jgi:hypothetical protein